MNKKLLLILNPISGKGYIKNKLLSIIDIFIKGGWSVSVHTTQSVNDAFEFVTANGDCYERVVVSGGDGTLNEVICGVLNIAWDRRPEIGYIPSGTVNDFASNMHIPKNMIKAAQKAVTGNQFKCDVGKFNQKNFVYVAAFGAFTNVPYQTPQQTKNAIGQLAYFLEGIKQLHTLPSYKVKVTMPEESFEEELVFGMISNSNRIAGFKTDKAFKAQLNDGLFEVMLVKRPKTLMELQDLVARLITQDLNTDAIRIFRTDKIRIKADVPVQWTLDGEFGGTVKVADIMVKKEAVTLII